MYKNAPATKILATQCACCGRPLLDAVSVETGVGPDCRKKHGYADAQGPADFKTACQILACANAMTADEIAEYVLKTPREFANKLMWLVAVHQYGGKVPAYVAAIAALGFTLMADRIAERLGGVVVEEDEKSYYVYTKYNEDWNAAVRKVKGQRWDGEKKCRVIPRTAENRQALWAAMKSVFPKGTLVRGSGRVVVL